MKRKLNTKYLALFVLLAAACIIVLFAPRQQKFHYEYSLGKPWVYEGLLTTYKFPVYKDPEAFKAEQDSAMLCVHPFYNIDSSVQVTKLAQLDDFYKTLSPEEVPPIYYNYLRNTLKERYAEGIMTEDELQKLRDENFLEINLMLSKNLVRSRPLGLIYSKRKTYDDLMDNLPPNMKKETMAKLNPAQYIAENLKYNEIETNKIREIEAKKISPSTGVIQKGESIVNKGQIVTKEIFRVLQSYERAENEKTGISNPRFNYEFGKFLVISLLLFGLWLFFYHFRPTFLNKIQNILFVTSLLLLFVLLTVFFVPHFSEAAFIIPYAIIPIVVRPFFQSRTSFFVLLITVLISALFVSEPLNFVVAQLVAGMASLYSLRTLNSRAQLVRTSFIVFLTYVLTVLSLALMQKGSIDSHDGIHLLYLGANLVCLTLSYMLIYPIEKIFGYVSNVSLVELSDVNSPLLRQLSETAPGTFQHSMQVSILASEAATRIGADAQLIRTGALYHDIGKMLNPSFFTENQGTSNGHDKLSYKESAAVIIKHVTDGVMLAQKHRLPRAITDFILTHHGMGRVKYFYTLYCNEHPDEYVDPAPFSYPGPNPSTKEQGILMLADCTEAASRSLKVYTEESIATLVNNIVESIMSEHMLDNTPLTFKDITQIKEVFIDKLRTIYHSRIEYPKANNSASAQPARS